MWYLVSAEADSSCSTVSLCSSTAWTGSGPADGGFSAAGASAVTLTA